MQIKELLKGLLQGRSYTLVIGVLLFGSSIFSYLSSNNNLELTHKLEDFDDRVSALEITSRDESSAVGSNREAIIVIETRLETIVDTLSEIKSDIKFLITDHR